MQLLHPCCAGLDIHKKTVVACVLLSREGGQVERQLKSFGTTTAQLLELLEWLVGLGVTHAVMESTGVYWWPVYQLLEGHLHLTVANAAHVKALPGRKTDQSDPEWLADLHRHGLVRGSFVPPRPQRELRELTRHRLGLTAGRSRAFNQIERTLEGTNLKLASVVSTLNGVSARLMLAALAQGQSDPKALAELAKGRLREKMAQLEAALQGSVRDYQRLMIGQLLADIELLDEQIEAVSAMIAQRLEAQKQLIERLDLVPGVNRNIAEVYLAEVGTDTKRFGTAERAASWAGLCPGNNESGGKRRSGRTRKGDRALKVAMVQAGHAAGHCKHSYFGAQYRRLAGRRGKKRAALAVGHAIFKVCFHMIDRGTPYQDLGANYFDQRNSDVVKHRLVKRLEKLGYKVTLTAAPAPPQLPNQALAHAA